MDKPEQKPVLETELYLGIDTGGTFTDAVLYDPAKGGSMGVIAKAKSLTTRHDLAIGISGAIGGLFAEDPIDPKRWWKGKARLPHS
jgi:N-methylhydantoinase A/oxoprolinase/acetone carboxylase beta subunit